MSKDTEMYERNGYSYNDLTKAQKRFVDGMLMIREEVCEFETEDAFHAEDSVISKMRAEIAREVIDELDTHIICMISDVIISFIDQSIVEIEKLPRKVAEKKYGKRLVSEVLG